MVHSSMLIVTTDGEHLSYSGFSLGETDRFGILEFIADCFDILSLSPMGNDSSIIFVGMARSGLLSLRPIIKDFPDEFYTVPNGEGRSDFPISRRRSMGTLPVPIMTTPWPEDAPTP
jgi:hypothetical protein